MALPYDTSTAFFMAGVFYQTLPIMAWLVLAGQSSRPTVLWCGGGVLAGLALMLLSLAGKAPPWQTQTLAQMLLMLSHLARIQSLRLDLGCPWNERLLVWMALCYLLIYELFRSVLVWPNWRMTFVTIASVSALAHLAWLAWRTSREQGSRNALVIAIGYMLLTVAAATFLIDLIATREFGPITAPRISLAILLVMVMLSSVLGHLGYVGLVLDRSLRQRMQAAAAHAREEEGRRLAEQIAVLDRQRSLGEMAASLGHELNQPLTAVLTNAQVMQRALRTDKLDTGQREDLVAKIIHNTHRAGQIIERIRDFIQPKASRVETVDLQRVVREVMLLVADDARSRDVHFSLPGQSAPARVRGDPIQLSQVLLNVFRNAIEALSGQAQRLVTVDIASRAGQVVLTVRDSGPGLAPDVLARAGAPYLTTKASGLGMGLVISRSIARQHQGSLTLRNAGPEEGGGAVVELSLPALSGR